MARITNTKNAKPKNNGNFEIVKAVSRHNKDFDEQLLMLSDEKIPYSEMKRCNVETYLIKLDQYTRVLQVKQSQERQIEKQKNKKR